MATINPTQQQPLLGEMLISRGLVSAEDVDRALEIQQQVGGRIGALLLRIGAISEDLLLTVLSEQLGLTYLRSGEDFPDSLSAYQFMSASPIKLDWFIDQQVLLWNIPDGDELGCLARDLLDNSLWETLRYFYPTRDIRFLLAQNHQIDRLVDFVRKERAVERLFSSDSLLQLREMAEEAPVVELVNNLLAQAVDTMASDIHIEPEEDHLSIRFRVDGVLHAQMTQPVERFPAIASRIKLIAGIDISERRLPQDGRISLRISGKEIDLRVSTVPCVHGESIVLRLLPKERDDLVLQNLGMDDDHLDMFRRWMQVSNGIVLVTGPTGSGKSTTLYSALNDVNDGVKKIITVEDPVENQIPHVTQIQAHAEIDYTFARALRAILRHDPDVIMIGEIRDLETAEIAIQSALTGHLVMSTIHTNSAVSAFTRLVDMGVEPFLVAAPIRGVQAQRLVRRLCERCAVSSQYPEGIGAHLVGLEDKAASNWKKAVGCDACHNTGYRGRMGIYELVSMTPELQQMITDGATLNEITARVAALGYRNLLQDGLLKASRGQTTVDEVLRLTLTED